MPAILAPRLWLGHVLALVLTVAAVLLGVWQLDAWQARRADAARDLTQADPVALSSVLGPDDPFPGRSVGQPVQLEGSWLPTGTVLCQRPRARRRRRLLDGDTARDRRRTHAPALPVVLGWVPDPDAAPAPPQGRAELVGWLQPPEGTGAHDDDPTDDVLPQLRIADVVQHVDQDLYGAYAIAREGVDGLPAADLAQLPEAGRFTAVRNLFYAIEWWFFGGFVVLIWWRWVGEQLAPDPDAPAEEDEDQPRYRDDVKGLLTAYRVLAIVVGVLLAFCSLVALPLKYLAAEGSTLQQFGEDASIMWLFHGWIFMVYVVVAFLLARKAGWSIGFTVVVLAAGLIPLLIFWVERRVMQKVRAENPDLDPVAHSDR